MKTYNKPINKKPNLHFVSRMGCAQFMRYTTLSVWFLLLGRYVKRVNKLAILIILGTLAGCSSYRHYAAWSVKSIECARTVALEDEEVIGAIATQKKSEFVISNAKTNGIPKGFVYLETSKGIGILEFYEMKGSTWVATKPGVKNDRVSEHNTDWMESFLKRIVKSINEDCRYFTRDGKDMRST